MHLLSRLLAIFALLLVVRRRRRRGLAAAAGGGRGSGGNAVSLINVAALTFKFTFVSFACPRGFFGFAHRPAGENQPESVASQVQFEKCSL